MTEFKIGDKVRFRDDHYMNEGKNHYVSDLGNGFVYLDGLTNTSGKGQSPTSLELVERGTALLPQDWQDKIEAALGRDALVTLGVVKAIPRFKVGDRVKVVGYTGWGKVTITEVNPEHFTPNIYKVLGDNGKTARFADDELEPVKMVTTTKTAVRVAFDVEGQNVDYVKGRIANLLHEETGFDVRGDVVTYGYEYIDTEEV